MVACLASMIVTAMLLTAAEIRFGPAELSLARWYVPLATATLAYILASSVTVFFDGPVRVVMWTAVAVGGLRLVTEVRDCRRSRGASIPS